MEFEEPVKEKEEKMESSEKTSAEKSPKKRWELCDCVVVERDSFVLSSGE